MLSNGELFWYVNFISVKKTSAKETPGSPNLGASGGSSSPAHACQQGPWGCSPHWGPDVQGRRGLGNWLPPTDPRGCGREIPGSSLGKAVRSAHLSNAGAREGHDHGHHVDRQLELQELGDAVVDVAAPHDRLDDAGEVVISQDDV